MLNEANEPLGEARFWAAGSHGEQGAWTGWLHQADLGELPPGRYRVAAFAGWEGAFQIEPGATATRVIETDLVPFVGSGAAPWPEDTAGPRLHPELVGTPWQSARGIPPFKQQGDGRTRPTGATGGSVPTLKQQGDGRTRPT